MSKIDTSRKIFLRGAKKIFMDLFSKEIKFAPDIDSLLCVFRNNIPCLEELLISLGIQKNFNFINDQIFYELGQKVRFDLFEKSVRYDTQGIVNCLAYQLSKLEGVTDEIPFGDWMANVNLHLDALAEFLPDPVASRLPFSSDVMALVYSEIFGKMPFSRSYVIRNYEHNLEGKDYLLFPSNRVSPSRLLVLFSGNVGRKTYNRYSWYWDETEHWLSDTVCLFLNDVDSHWYVGKAGENDRLVYKKIITSIMARFDLNPSSVITIGGSMGGYGAIIFAVELGLKAAIAVHPQLCFRSALRYKEISWEKSFRECGENFRDVADEVFRFDRRPVVYIENGDCEVDQVGFDELLYALRKRNSLVILRKTDNADHLTDSPSKKKIDSIVNFVESFDFDG